MKSKILGWTTALSLLAMLAAPVQLAAQNKQDHCQHHHYQVVDLGSTFGGPQSYFVPGSGGSFAGSLVLSSGGTVAGFADTSLSDPFPNFCWSQDCFVADSFLAESGGHLKNIGALPGGGSSAPLWITGNGLVAGVSENGETDPLFAGGFPEMHAVLWEQGKITDLGTLPEGGYQSEANGVNSAGQVVGAALNTIPDANSMAAGNFWYFNVPYGYQQRAFLWDKQKGMRDLGTLPGGTDAEALLINELGQVVGYSYTSSTQGGTCLPIPLATSSFLWEEGKGMRDLGSLGGTCTLAAYLNNQGQVVGSSNLNGDQSSHAFLWEHGSIQDLGGSLGGDFTGAYAVNEAGQAAGFAYLPGDNTFHAALWKHVGELTDLGTVGNDTCSYASAINANGQVVGNSNVCEGNSRGFLWEDGAIFDLNTLIAPGSALYLQLTRAINDRGEIAGDAVDASGNQHAFLLIPCDENHPDVEGCDYSLADASAAPPAPRTVPGGIQRPSTSRWTNQYRFPGLAGATMPGADRVTLLPTRLRFECRSTMAGCQCINEGTATLTNTGSTTLRINGITVTGPFTQSNKCGRTLGAGKSCAIGIRWTESTGGGWLSVSDNGVGSPQKVSLEGLKECNPQVSGTEEPGSPSAACAGR
jgi:probable HAF family extracellular repeat protein